jgi:hypothetical protein
VKKEIDNFELYPNPASTEVTIRYKNIPLNCKIIIYNTIGIKVIEQATINENGSTTINVAKLINGLYLYKIVDSNNRCIVKNKFTITK